MTEQVENVEIPEETPSSNTAIIATAIGGILVAAAAAAFVRWRKNASKESDGWTPIENDAS